MSLRFSLENMTAASPERRHQLRVAGSLTVATVALAIIITVATATSTPKANVSTATTVRAQQAAIVVTITDQGFTPASVLVKRDSSIEWINQTTSPHQVGANPYPTHSSLNDLFSGLLSPEASYVYTFKQAGTFSYSDYSNPTHGGTVIVQ